MSEARSTQNGDVKVTFKVSFADGVIAHALAVGENATALASGHSFFFFNCQISVEAVEAENGKEKSTATEVILYDEAFFQRLT